MSRWTAARLPDLSDRTFVITGANSGVGFEAARSLAHKGARVVLACRSTEKARAAADEIRAERDDARVEAMTLDLASLASVRAFADELALRCDRGVDALINNAGVMALPRRLTADGFEMQLGTNHLGHFALTGLVLPLLVKRSAARVVNVSSAVHVLGRIDFDDLMGERRYGRWRAYNQSKLANLLFTRELQHRLSVRHPAVIAAAAHPGYSSTNILVRAAETRAGVMVESFRLGNSLLAQSAAMGAMPTVRAAADLDVKGDDFFGPAAILWGHPVRVRRHPRARDDAAARRLWSESVRLTGVDYGGL